MPQRLVATSVLGGAIMAALACSAGQLQLPEPRRLVIFSGARLATTQERMEEVHDWVREQWDSIALDPSFFIDGVRQDGPVYPWETLEIHRNERQDTARITFDGLGQRRTYHLYAHLHLMADLDRLDRWLPDAAAADEFDRERLILARVADAWLYQRAILDFPPDGILDELLYVNENGYMREFLLTARPEAFVEARRAWRAEHPDGNAAFVEWFRQTFERDPPGFRGSP